MKILMVVVALLVLGGCVITPIDGFHDHRGGNGWHHDDRGGHGRYGHAGPYGR